MNLDIHLVVSTHRFRNSLRHSVESPLLSFHKIDAHQPVGVDRAAENPAAQAPEMGVRWLIQRRTSRKNKGMPIQYIKPP